MTPLLHGPTVVSLVVALLALALPAPAQTVTVAMCQIVCLDGDREGNFVRIENAVREAADAGADIACFPESAILGWVNPDAHTRALPIPGGDSDRLCELARRYKTHLCAGLDEKDGTNLYDAAVLIDDTGKLLLKHRKIENLLNEKGLMVPPYTCGSEIAEAETRFGKIGVLICADTFGDDRLRRMAVLKPALVLVPYGWVADETAWPQHGNGLANVVRHAAEVIGAPVIGTDPVGQVSHGAWAGKYYGGLSVAYDEHGQQLGVAADRDRDVKIVTVPLATAREAKSPTP
jgi:predicted amidohydrolase